MLFTLILASLLLFGASAFVDPVQDGVRPPNRFTKIGCLGNFELDPATVVPSGRKCGIARDQCLAVARLRGFKLFAASKSGCIAIKNASSVEVLGGPSTPCKGLTVYQDLDQQGVPANISYLGCYVDIPNRVIDYKQYSGGLYSTVEQCRNAARRTGHKYFGLSLGTACYSTNNLTKITTAIQRRQQSDACVVKCPANQQENCGGVESIAVYMDVTSPAPAQAPYPKAQYVGCYGYPSDASAVGTWFTARLTMSTSLRGSVERCRTAAVHAHFAYFALRGPFCYGTNDVTPVLAANPAYGLCDTVCVDNITQTCGGTQSNYQAFAVYAVNAATVKVPETVLTGYQCNASNTSRVCSPGSTCHGGDGWSFCGPLASGIASPASQMPIGSASATLSAKAGATSTLVTGTFYHQVLGGPCGGTNTDCANFGGPCEDKAWTHVVCPAGTSCRNINSFWWSCLPDPYLTPFAFNQPPRCTPDSLPLNSGDLCHLKANVTVPPEIFNPNMLSNNTLVAFYYDQLPRVPQDTIVHNSTTPLRVTVPVPTCCPQDEVCSLASDGKYRCQDMVVFPPRQCTFKVGTGGQCGGTSLLAPATFTAAQYKEFAQPGPNLAVCCPDNHTCVAMGDEFSYCSPNNGILPTDPATGKFVMPVGGPCGGTGVDCELWGSASGTGTGGCKDEAWDVVECATGSACVRYNPFWWACSNTDISTCPASADATSFPTLLPPRQNGEFTSSVFSVDNFTSALPAQSYVCPKQGNNVLQCNNNRYAYNASAPQPYDKVFGQIGPCTPGNNGRVLCVSEVCCNALCANSEQIKDYLEPGLPFTPFASKPLCIAKPLNVGASQSPKFVFLVILPSNGVLICDPALIQPRQAPTSGASAARARSRTILGR